MKTILIIEDDIVFSRSISNWLVKKGMKTECVATLANARKAIGQKEFDLILADLRLPDGNSTSLLKWMNEKYYSIPFLIMTNYGQVENAVTTMQLGAINYLCKPVQPDNLLALITEILDKNDNEQEFYRGESPKAHEMYRLIEMIACADISVLLRGASGTGKEHIAAEIHARSHRKNKHIFPFGAPMSSNSYASSRKKRNRRLLRILPDRVHTCGHSLFLPKMSRFSHAPDTVPSHSEDSEEHVSY